VGSQYDLFAGDGYEHSKARSTSYVFGVVWLTKFDRIWAIWDGSVYDLTNYVYTLSLHPGTSSSYEFLNTDVVNVFKQQAGQDISNTLNSVISGLDSQTASNNVQCIKQMAYMGETDFRKTPRCRVQSYLLLVFTGILCASIVLKCRSCQDVCVTRKSDPSMSSPFRTPADGKAFARDARQICFVPDPVLH
jgi:Cytochrome b5-like Heme/Steroid binding domain